MKKASCILVGGNVEGEETFEEAALREMKEETGYSIKNLKPVFNRISEGEVDYEAVTFLAELDLSQPRAQLLEEETGVVAWVAPEKLMEGPFGEYNTRLFKAVSDNDSCTEVHVFL
jgi:8-oxo-dGTP pyrophosphatase MutT (NUDIX family)